MRRTILVVYLSVILLGLAYLITIGAMGR